jgi:hypothetical protein
VGVTSPRLLLAAGSVAASLAGIGPAVVHGSPVAAPLQVGADGVAVSIAQLRGGSSQAVTVDVPQGISRLSGAASGSPALAGRVRLVVTRGSDGAVLFTGSLATFRSLPVESGASLVVKVQKPVGFRGLEAGALLRWS